MAAQIVKRYVEAFPAMRLIGRCYGEADRVGGGFGAKWGECFATGHFAPLEALPKLAVEGDAYVGAMRDNNGAFEYWIGVLAPQGTPVPDGYDSAELAAFEAVTCYLYGDEKSGELYGMAAHTLCVQSTAELGRIPDAAGWRIERYNCPRFTAPDAQGKVILDYSIAVQ